MLCEFESQAEASAIDALIEKHGIVRVPADTFEYNGYRYTNLKDAVAEAERNPVGTA